VTKRISKDLEFKEDNNVVTNWYRINLVPRTFYVSFYNRFCGVIQI